MGLCENHTQTSHDRAAMRTQDPARAGSEVLVEGDLVAARVGAQAGHDARLLVIAHALLKEVGLAPVQPNVTASASEFLSKQTCMVVQPTMG